MKRKTLSVIAALIFFFCLLPPQKTAAASDVCFIATNDTLLELSSSAHYQRSTLYVPYNVFVYFSIYYSYYASGSTATLYTADKQLYFELDSGVTYDSSGNNYSSSAIYINGQVYVSVSFVCSQFGLSWSYIYGTDSGDICRIKNSGAILSDSQFLSAASSVMADRYNAYTGSASNPGTLSPSPSGGMDQEGRRLYLSFQNLPSRFLLDTLKSYCVSATFFVTADEVRDDPDTIRRIVGEGHNIGVLCSSSPVEEYEETSALIFEAARVNTVLIAADSPDSEDLCRRAADKNALVFWDYKIDGVRGSAGISHASFVTAYLAFYTERADVRIQCCDATDDCITSVLKYIVNNNFNLYRVCEIGNTI